MLHASIFVVNDRIEKKWRRHLTTFINCKTYWASVSTVASNDRCHVGKIYMFIFICPIFTLLGVLISLCWGHSTLKTNRRRNPTLPAYVCLQWTQDAPLDISNSVSRFIQQTIFWHALGSTLYKVFFYMAIYVLTEIANCLCVHGSVVIVFNAFVPQIQDINRNLKIFMVVSEISS